MVVKIVYFIQFIYLNFKILENLWSDWVECDNCTVGIRYKTSICSYGTCRFEDPNYKIMKEDCNKWDKKKCPCKFMKKNELF